MDDDLILGELIMPIAQESGFPNNSPVIVSVDDEVFGFVMPYKPELHPTAPTVNPGIDQDPYSHGQKVALPKGTVGVVQESSPFLTTVLVPLHESGELKPQLVKAQGPTSAFRLHHRDPFYNVPRGKSRPRPLTPEEDSAMGQYIINSKWRQA